MVRRVSSGLSRDPNRDKELRNRDNSRDLAETRRVSLWGDQSLSAETNPPITRAAKSLRRSETSGHERPPTRPKSRWIDVPVISFRESETTAELGGNRNPLRELALKAKKRQGLLAASSLNRGAGHVCNRP